MKQQPLLRRYIKKHSRGAAEKVRALGGGYARKVVIRVKRDERRERGCDQGGQVGAGAEAGHGEAGCNLNPSSLKAHHPGFSTKFDCEKDLMTVLST